MTSNEDEQINKLAVKILILLIVLSFAAGAAIGSWLTLILG